MTSNGLFELLPKRWYASEIFGWDAAPAQPHPSAVFLRKIEPQKTGHGLLKIEFFHANYPEGVQNKEYLLRVLHRSETHLAAVRNDKEQILMLLFPLRPDWMKTHFPNFDSHGDPEAALNRIFRNL